MDDLTAAVRELWATVLDRPDLCATDDLTALLYDLDVANDATTLLNQWLGSGLTVWQVFALKSPDRIAEYLREQGVAAPVLQVPASADPRINLLSADVTEYRRSMWDATYRFSGSARAADFNSAGWFDSASQAPMPAEHMREWVRTTVERIASLAPKSVLDVGCGSGLILTRLAPHCARYIGVDFSGEAVGLIRKAVRANPALRHVETFEAAAADMGDRIDGRYDVVVINSVLQYFPDLAYLRSVLSGAAARTEPGGHVFLGDIRNRDLRRAEHLATVLGGTPGSTRVRRARTALTRVLDADKERSYSPDDLARTVDELNLGCDVVALVRRGAHQTVMNRFRFDCVLSFGRRPAPPVAEEVEWATLDGSEAIEKLLAQPVASIVIRNVPDRRTIDAVRLLEAFDAAPPDTPVHALTGRAAADKSADPEALWNLGQAAGYGVAVSPGSTPGHVDAAFCRDQNPWTTARLLGGANNARVRRPPDG